MTSKDIREKYIQFFVAKGHKEIPPAPLVLEGDPTTLFTSAGMQPLIPYLKGEKHPQGKRLVDIQPSLRLQDIEEVGDISHTTFFEMLGNWSLGDYFKKEQLVWIWQFFTKELKIPEEKLFVTVFKGNKEIPRDEESIEIWKGLGLPEERIVENGVDKNWWSRSGTPDQMPSGEIGGPDSEIFYDFGTPVHEGCHPNCDCGRFLEIGNSVFMQYQKQEDGSLKEMKQKNVDFGGGLERIAAVLNNDPDIFKIDLFSPIIKELESKLKVKYAKDDENTKSLRIIADHIKASVFLIAEGIEPSNKLQGYILRRLLRRSAAKTFLIDKNFDSKDFKSLVDIIADTYLNHFETVDRNKVKDVISLEIRKFRNTIERGFKEIEKYSLDQLNTLNAFNLYQSYGFPFEVAKEEFEKRGGKVNKEEFDKTFKYHQELSRKLSANLFKGGLADNSQEVTKLHTTTHLLHAALRKVLGEEVAQKGSNITTERLRFDFSHPQKLTEEQLKEVEDLINEQIEKKLAVTFKEESLDEAIAEGALHFFAEKYGEKVKVYSIGDFSKEVCGGPHVTNTSEIGHVKIKKQEKVGAGVMRIYASLD